jgi:hypothetical protein
VLEGAAGPPPCLILHGDGPVDVTRTLAAELRSREQQTDPVKRGSEGPEPDRSEPERIQGRR